MTFQPCSPPRRGRAPVLPLLLVPLLFPLEAVAAQCQNQRLTPAGAAPSDQFGKAAAVDATGSVAVVGAPAQGTALAGTAYVYERSGEVWSEVAALEPAEPTFNDRFGADVDVDGDVVIVGAPGDDDGGNNAGAAYVARKVGGAWTPEAKLTAPAPQAGATFGFSVAVSGDLAVVGAPEHDLGTGGPLQTREGLVYLFQNDGGGWSFDRAFRAPVPEDVGVYGSSLAAQGDFIVVGASHPHWLGMEEAFVYRRLFGVWELLNEIASPGATGGDRFGLAVDFDVDRVVIGAPDARDPGLAKTGAAYVYHGLGGGALVLEDTLQPAELQAGDAFGTSVAIAAGRVLAGAPGHVPAPGAEGSAFLFELTGESWPAAGTLLPADPAAVGEFGSAAGLAGGRALVGAATGTSPPGSGAAYDFQLEASECLLVTDVKSISLASGGSQTLSLDAGPGLAAKLYLVLGSASGTAPGLPLGPFLVPLNLDDYTLFTITNANQGPLVNTSNNLTAEGLGVAQIAVPPGFNPGLAGLTLHHAFLALEPSNLMVLEASNARSLDLLP